MTSLTIKQKRSQQRGPMTSKTEGKDFPKSGLQRPSGWSDIKGMQHSWFPTLCHQRRSCQGLVCEHETVVTYPCRWTTLWACFFVNMKDWWPTHVDGAVGQVCEHERAVTNLHTWRRWCCRPGLWTKKSGDLPTQTILWAWFVNMKEHWPTHVDDMGLVCEHERAVTCLRRWHCEPGLWTRKSSDLPMEMTLWAWFVNTKEQWPTHVDDIVSLVCEHERAVTYQCRWCCGPHLWTQKSSDLPM